MRSKFLLSVAPDQCALQYEGVFLVRCEAVDEFEQTITYRNAFRMWSLFRNLGIQSRMLLRYKMNHALPSLMTICCEVFSWGLMSPLKTPWII